MPSGLVIPSYKAGFATPQRGELKYPQLWRDCIGAWNMGLGATGKRLFDYSGHSNHGTQENMDQATDWVASDGSVALDFDGSDDRVDIGRRELLTGLTFAAWINTTSTDATAGYAGNAALTIVGETSGSIWNGFGIHGGKVRYTHWTSSWQLIDSAASVNDGNWHHVAATHDLAGAVAIYVNGVVSGSATGITYNTSYTGFNTIGAGYPAPGSDLFQGLIGEVRVHRSALTPGEIKLLAQRRGIAYEPQRIVVRAPVAGGTTVTPTNATLTTAAFAPTVTPTVTPTSLTATALGPSSILVDWAHTGGATYFELQRRIKAGA